VAPIINGGTAIDAEHAAAIQHTQAKEMEDKTRKEHRRRIRHLYTWWHDNYIDYFENGTCALSDDEKKDLVRFHHTNDRDIIYEGLNVNLVLAFLVTKIIKANGKMSSVSDISKYNDAIKWGAGVAEQRLPTEYYEKIEKFVAAYKKEHAGAKKEGNVDEREADPINASLFTLICKWAVEEMNIFIWVFSLLMWHMMARSISISSIALHNIKRGVSDSIQFKYDETKMDKSGEFVQTKNCYANPQTPYLCLYLALGCWLSINSESFETTEKLSSLLQRMALHHKHTVVNFQRWRRDTSWRRCSFCDCLTSMHMELEKGAEPMHHLPPLFHLHLLLLQLEANGAWGRYVIFTSNLQWVVIITLVDC